MFLYSALCSIGQKLIRGGGLRNVALFGVVLKKVCIVCVDLSL